MRLLITLILSLWVAGCVHDGAGVFDDEPRFEELEPNAPFPVKVPSGFDAVYGYLVVPADRHDRDAGSVRLPVVTIRGEAPTSLAPIVRLQGGPGVGSLRAAAYPRAYPWVGERDFIIMGQRGTHHAQPDLRCPGFREAYANAQGSADPDLLAVTEKCREETAARGIDTGDYHSASSAADIDDLREALGYDEISLYGLSYGTRLALTYARDYPDRVSSMVLDSPLPHTARYDDESPENLRFVLERIIEACSAQLACDEAYPNLSDRFFSAIEDAKRQPWTLANGRKLGATDLIGLLPLGSRARVARAPMVMDAIARRDMEPFADQLDGISLGTDFSWGMRLSVWCSEALPYAERYRTQRPSDRFAGLDGAVVSPEVCEAWNVPKRPSREVEPARGDYPVLLIAGEYDVNTPPRWATQAAETLENATVITITGGFHSESTNWGGDGCAMSLVDAFFEEPASDATASPAAACLANQRAPTFELPN